MRPIAHRPQSIPFTHIILRRMPRFKARGAARGFKTPSFSKKFGVWTVLLVVFGVVGEWWNARYRSPLHPRKLKLSLKRLYARYFWAFLKKRLPNTKIHITSMKHSIWIISSVLALRNLVVCQTWNHYLVRPLLLLTKKACNWLAKVLSQNPTGQLHEIYWSISRFAWPIICFLYHLNLRCLTRRGGYLSYGVIQTRGHAG